MFICLSVSHIVLRHSHMWSHFILKKSHDMVSLLPCYRWENRSSKNHTQVCTKACLMTTYALMLATSWKMSCNRVKRSKVLSQNISSANRRSGNLGLPQCTWINKLKFLLTTNSAELECCQELVSKLQFLCKEVGGYAINGAWFHSVSDY